MGSDLKGNLGPEGDFHDGRRVSGSGIRRVDGKRTSPAALRKVNSSIPERLAKKSRELVEEGRSLTEMRK